ncbi:MAG: M48 family metallopeptidase [Bacteroidota bacterium]|nr:M48 family metallopeptidase [Bacteroidota bacterium]
MRLLLSSCLLLIFIGSSSAQSHAPLEPNGKVPSFFYNPSHVLVNQEIGKRNASGDIVDAKEEAFIREMSYFAQQRMISGIVLFNDSLSAYVSKVAKVLLKDDTATFNKLHFYVYKSPDPNAYTSATGNILITVGLLAQLDNEAQLAFILAHEITHYRQGHMLKGYLNREELKEQSGSTPSYLLLSSYYSYNQEQELEADKLGFELYKKSSYSVREALRSFDVLDYSDLPFDDVTFDTTFFNKDYLTIPAGYFMKEVDPIYSDDNYEDRNSTHPNVRKRRMALMTEVDTVKNPGTHLYVVSKTDFLYVRETSRYEICRLYLIERNYPGAIYSAYMLLQRHPDDIYLKKIIGHSLYEIAAYNQVSAGSGYYNPYLMYDYAGNVGRYSSLKRNGYYRIPDFKDYPGQQQQLYHLFHEMEPDELTVLALSYNWGIHKADPADKFQASLCDSLFIMLVNKQNLHLSYFSTGTPDEAKEQFRKDSLQRVAETGETGESKYSRMDKFRLNSQKERFTKFAFVEMLKDTAFVSRFKYYTDHRASLVSTGDVSWYSNRTKKERALEEKENESYGEGIQKIIVVGPDYEMYQQLERKQQSEQNFMISETGQENLGNTIKAEATGVGMDCILLSAFSMDSLDGDSYADLATLNEWFYERIQHGSGGYATTMNNQAQVDSLIAKYGTRYVMFTGVQVEYRKRIQHPFWFGVSCLVVVPVIRAFIPRNNMSYDAVVMDLKTGEVISLNHRTFLKGKEAENTSEFYKNLFDKMHKVKKPKADGKPVTELERGM